MDDVKKGSPTDQDLQRELEQKEQRIRELEQALDEMTMAMEVISTPASVRDLLARVMTGEPWLRRRAPSEKDRLLTSLSQAPVTINVLRGPDLVFELAHPSTVRALGARQVIGKPLAEAIPELKGQPFPDLLRRVLTTGERVDAKEQLARLDTDGSGQLRDTYWDYSYLPLLDGDGRVEAVMTFDLDVTVQVVARRELEAKDEQIRRLFSRTDAGIAHAHLDGRIALTNARYRAILGRTEAELLQSKLDDLIRDDLADKTERFRELVEAGTPFAANARHERPDGSMVWLQCALSRLEGPGGRPHGLVAITVEGVAP